MLWTNVKSGKVIYFVFNAIFPCPQFVMLRASASLKALPLEIYTLFINFSKCDWNEHAYCVSAIVAAGAASDDDTAWKRRHINYF